jgi:hypothetical protein
VIACLECGWAAIGGTKQIERSLFEGHCSSTGCEGPPATAPSPSPYRARLCVHGHTRDIFGACWTCLVDGRWTPG